MAVLCIADTITVVIWWAWNVIEIFTTALIIDVIFVLVVVLLLFLFVLLDLFVLICVIPWHPPPITAPSRPRRPTTTSSTQKGYEAVSSALSVFSGPPQSPSPTPAPSRPRRRTTTSSTQEGHKTTSSALSVFSGPPPSPPSPPPTTTSSTQEGHKTTSSALSVFSGRPPSPPPTTTSSTQKGHKNTSSALSVFSGPPLSRSPSTPTTTWSTQEGYEATAAAFSVITGVNIIREKDVQKQIELGKKVTALDIKDVFYGRFSSSKKEVDDQEQLFYIPDSAYDPPAYDCDFTDYKGDDTNCTRGGYPYKRPAGWNRKAVQVIGKYEDDVWLGQQGWRDESSPGEWAVSYHGTKIQNVSSIVVDGYDTKKCVKQVHGPGIYSTPDIKVAEDYATDFNYKGEKCKCILQNRVNLKKTKEVKTVHGIYFVTPDDGDIRPYGVCIKKI